MKIQRLLSIGCILAGIVTVVTSMMTNSGSMFFIGFLVLVMGTFYLSESFYEIAHKRIEATPTHNQNIKER